MNVKIRIFEIVKSNIAILEEDAEKVCKKVVEFTHSKDIEQIELSFEEIEIISTHFASSLIWGLVVNMGRYDFLDKIKFFKIPSFEKDMILETVKLALCKFERDRISYGL